MAMVVSSVGLAVGGVTMMLVPSAGGVETTLVGVSEPPVLVELGVSVISGKVKEGGRTPVVSGESPSSYPTTRELGKLPSVESSVRSGSGVVAAF